MDRGGNISIIKTIRRALSYYKEHFLRLIGISFLMTIVTIMRELLNRSARIYGGSGLLLKFLLGLGLTGLSMYISLALINAVCEIYKDEYFNVAGKRFWSYVGVNLLVGFFLIIAGFLPFFMVISAKSIIMKVIGGIILVAVEAFLGARFFLTDAIVVIEQTGADAAFRSNDLVKKQFFRVLIITGLFTLLQILPLGVWVLYTIKNLEVILREGINGMVILYGFYTMLFNPFFALLKVVIYEQLSHLEQQELNEI